MAGWGDALIASGLAKGLHAQGKRAAFGDGRRIIWDTGTYDDIFRHNPNVAWPGDEGAPDLKWIHYYKGHRLYAESGHGRWRFLPFRCPPGEIYFDQQELEYAKQHATAAVILEPRVKTHGACVGANKQWPVRNYAMLAHQLRKRGWTVGQFVPPGMRPLLDDVQAITTRTFRRACAILQEAELYIGPEGGLHHAAAAVGTDAVVIFGGFNSPRSTGYEQHINISVGEPCGNISRCEHCVEAMRSITVNQVLDAAMSKLLGEPTI